MGDRLKHKLGYSEEDDGTFWMQFDDFCSVFRCLYVCHYYHEGSKRWRYKKHNGCWSLGDDPDGDGGLDSFDTAAGLPSKHNRNCDVGKNPQYCSPYHAPDRFEGARSSRNPSRGDVSVQG